MVSPSPFRRKWIRWGIVVLALGLPWVFLMEPNAHHRCEVCGSWRNESQLRVGPTRAFSIPLNPVTFEVRDSLAATRLLGPSHQHKWVFTQGSDGYFVIRWGVICALGRRVQVNPFVHEWEEGTTFRAFVDGEREAGRLSPAEVVAMAEVPRRLTPDEAKDASVVSALARAQALFHASGLRDTGAGWSEWSLPMAATQGCPGPPR